MDKSVYSYIQRIYIKRDYDYFILKSKEIPGYYIDLTNLAKSLCTKITSYNANDDPAIELTLCFDEFIKGEFHVEYKTLLKISKIADLFVFQHEFCVENKDTNKTTPVLDGFGEEAYTNFQQTAENVLTNFLLKQELKKLKLIEMDEVIEGISIPPNTIFGSQMTLENALFKDLYGICGN